MIKKALWTLVGSTKKVIWQALGFISLGLAYVGWVTPMMPFSPFLVFSSYCFARSSPRMHKWLYNHKFFGPFLRNWNEKRVFPFKMKLFMLIMMTSSWFSLYFAGKSLKALIGSGVFMACVAIWAWRFPSSVEEYDRRIANGKKIGWFNNSF